MASPITFISARLRPSNLRPSWPTASRLKPSSVHVIEFVAPEHAANMLRGGEGAACYFDNSGHPPFRATARRSGLNRAAGWLPCEMPRRTPTAEGNHRPSLTGWDEGETPTHAAGATRGFRGAPARLKHRPAPSHWHRSHFYSRQGSARIAMVEGSGVAACGEDKLHRRRLFIRAIRTMELSRLIRVEMNRFQRARS